MKNILKSSLIILFIFTVYFGKSQGNLQYSKAIFLEISSLNSNTVYDTLTVPTGKVVKITSASATSKSLAGAILYINNVGIISSLFSDSDNSSFTAKCNMPIWLPSGIYILKLRPSSTSGGYAFLSGVEFNIIQ